MLKGITKEVIMKVKELMSTNIVCVKENATAEQIASHMRKNNVGSLPVCDDAGHVKGIVTDRDLVIRVLAKYSSVEAPEDANPASEITAADIMTTEPVTVSPEHNIHDASILFSAHKIRRLPVTEASRIVGMLSLGDVAVKPVYIDEAGDALSSISLADGLQSQS